MEKFLFSSFSLETSFKDGSERKLERFVSQFYMMRGTSVRTQAVYGSAVNGGSDSQRSAEPQQNL